MDARRTELYWLRAERWVNDRGFAQFHKGGRTLCPMCAVLPVSGSFLVNGVLLVLCLECVREMQAGRRWKE